MLPLAVVLNLGLLFTIISAVLARRDRRSAAAPPSQLDAAPWPVVDVPPGSGGFPGSPHW